ncbi:MAG: YitT family protein [Acidobacteria bacterium]|nr:YitT family protein [Acidobacteriota bacterium]
MIKGVPGAVVNCGLIASGIFSAAFGLKGFLLSSHFIDGGVTGVSMLVSNIFGFSLPTLLVIFNLPFIAFGYKQIGRAFAIKSTLGIVGLAVVLQVVHFPDVTPDKLLTAVFGGLFIGAGIGLAIRGGSVLDGTEIAALLISRRSYILNVGDVILIFNVLIFLAAAFFLGIEPAMYSILTYVAATKAIDFLIHGVEEYTAIMIVSTKNDEIREALVTKLRRGVTVLKGSGGLRTAGEAAEERDILYCVVTRLEIGVIKSAVTDIDQYAFITTHTLTEVDGGLIKRQLLH